MSLSHSQMIEMRWMGKKGRGVFARNKIEKGRLIERVPIVVFPAREVFGSLRQSKLAEYVFNWDDNLVALSLGYGSLYNHSFRPNARFYYEGRLTQVFSAIRDIEEGEEITVDYNGPEKNFDVVE